MEAASIAVATRLVGTPRMFATWLCAAGVRLSAAMIATILCPSLPQPHAVSGHKIRAKLRFAVAIARERDDFRRFFLFLSTPERTSSAQQAIRIKPNHREYSLTMDLAL